MAWTTKGKTWRTKAGKLGRTGRHRQAQLLDARSRGKVVVFDLSPEPPHMCVLAYADNLISASTERGYQDATTGADCMAPRFRKEPGEPIFTDVRPGGVPSREHE